MRPDLSECAPSFLETGMITPERMRAVDENAQALGVSGLQLMESAGKALAGSVLALHPASVLILCGSGNNGGDGMVAARYLQHGVETAVCYLDAGKRPPSCAHQLAALRGCRVSLHPFVSTDDLRALAPLFVKAEVIVDALLGTGGQEALKEPLATCTGMANASGAKIVSADVPTPGMQVTHICAFHRAKVSGSDVVDIGIPIEAEICTGPGDLTLIPARKSTSHKGAGGTVLVIGGGPYQGAPYLAGLAALRAGADIVRIASPVFEPFQTSSTNASPETGLVKNIQTSSSRLQCVLMSSSAGTELVLQAMTRSVPLPRTVKRQCSTLMHSGSRSRAPAMRRSTLPMLGNLPELPVSGFLKMPRMHAGGPGKHRKRQRPLAGQSFSRGQ